MSAAIEGALEGIPSIGFSLLDDSHNANFEEAESYIRKIAEEVLKHGLDSGICLNVNIPKSIKGEKFKPSVSSSTAICIRAYQYGTFGGILVAGIKFETQ